MLPQRASGLQIKCAQLAETGIDEACKVLLQEGGAREVLKFLAYMAHGEVLPAPVIARLKDQAACILSKCA